MNFGNPVRMPPCATFYVYAGISTCRYNVFDGGGVHMMIMVYVGISREWGQEVDLASLYVDNTYF